MATNDPKTDPPANENMIPKARLDEVIAQRDEARNQVATLGARVKELEPLETQVANLTKQSADEKAAAEAATAAANLRAEKVLAAVNAGLPVTMAERLQGANADELATDAQRLAPLFKPDTPGVPPPPPPAPPGPAITAEQMADPKWIRENEATIRDAAAAGQLPT